MSRKGKKGRGPSQPRIKGFRPGKEPAHLRARQAKAQLGEDSSWAQKAMIDAVAGRTPEEVRTQVNRWSTIILVVAVVLVLGGGLLYLWAVPAGIAVHVLAAAALFLWFRLRRQQAGLVEMAKSVGRRG
jgi:hypothetical protein